MGKGRYLSRADFHLPSGLVGATLLPGAERDSFKNIRDNVNAYMNNMTNMFQLVKVMDSVEDTKRLGHRKSMIVLSHVITYLRIKLLSKEVRIIELAAVVTDTLVKNGQFRIHILVGNRIFMKTISIIIGQLLADEKGDSCRVGYKVLDILLGWGESFSKCEKRVIYPHIVSTYEKMRFKYRFKYQRQDCDPLRVPILLSSINQYEILKPNQNYQALSGDEFADSHWDSDSISSNSTSLYESSISFCNKKESPVNKMDRLQRMYAARVIESKRSHHQLNFELESPVRWINTRKGWQIIGLPGPELKMGASISEALTPRNPKSFFETKILDLFDTDVVVKSPVRSHKSVQMCSKQNKCLIQEADEPDIFPRSIIVNACCTVLMECAPSIFTDIDVKEYECINISEKQLNVNDTDQDEVIRGNEITLYLEYQADSDGYSGEEVATLDRGSKSNLILSQDSKGDQTYEGLVDVGPSLSLVSDALTFEDNNLAVNILTGLSPEKYNSADLQDEIMCERNRGNIGSTEEILTIENKTASYSRCQADSDLKFREEVAPLERGSESNLQLFYESEADAMTSELMDISLNYKLESDYSPDVRTHTPQRNKRGGASGAEPEYAIGNNSKHTLRGSRQIVRYSTISMSPSNDRVGRVRYLSPSSDSTLTVKYYGHQRVLVKTGRSWR